MIIFLLPFAVVMLARNIKEMPQKDRFKVWLVVILYLFAMMYYCSYINAQPTSFGFGIPQADMLAHYRGAEALSKGYNWLDLAGIATRFESIGVNTIGYFLYTTFLSLCIFTFPVLSVGTNVYLVYVFQIILSVDTCVRYNRIIKNIITEQKKNTVFFCLVCCAPFIVQACQLMRDIYYMWMIAVLLEFMQKHHNVFNYIQSKHHNLLGKKYHTVVSKVEYYTILSVLMVMCIFLRFYSVIVFFPLVLYYGRKERLGVAASLSVSAVLIAGFGLINLLRQILGIDWEITTPDFGESIQFLLFPNILNQSKYLFDWYRYFGTTIDAGGCNVPGVYYIMSVWNIWVIPLSVIGLITGLRKHKWEHLMWGSILQNVVMTYSVTYDAIDTRHKFFMTIPLCFLAQRGIIWMKKKGAAFFFLYNCIVALAVLFILLFSW